MFKVSLIITATQGSEIVAKSKVEKMAVSGFMFSPTEQQVSGGFPANTAVRVKRRWKPDTHLLPLIAAVGAMVTVNE